MLNSRRIRIFLSLVSYSENHYEQKKQTEMEICQNMNVRTLLLIISKSKKSQITVTKRPLIDLFAMVLIEPIMKEIQHERTNERRRR